MAARWLTPSHSAPRSGTPASSWPFTGPERAGPKSGDWRAAPFYFTETVAMGRTARILRSTFAKNRLRNLAGPVAQWSELAAHNRLVAGSSPAGPTIRFRHRSGPGMEAI
jgi:hypothetical protein